MNWLQIKKSLVLFGILLLVIPRLFAKEQTGNAVAASDTVQLSMRLTSWLLINPETILDKQLDSLRQLNIPLAFLASGENKNGLENAVKKKSGTHIIPVISPEGVDALGGNDKNVVAISSGEIDVVQFGDDPANLQKQYSFRKFLWFSGIEKEIPAPDYFLRFWGQTGRMPNFIQAGTKNLAQAATIVRSLNEQQKMFGVVRTEDKLLADVSWKNYPGRKTNGFFSFPVGSSSDFQLAPYKAGYQFSPDIILPSPENLRNLKVFNAVPLDPDFGLTDDFIFIHRVRNLKRGNDEEIINYGVGFVKDKVQGKCARFSGKAYIDAGMKSRSALQPNFTVTAWVNPASLGHNNCILGKGKDFVLKLHDGKLTFTVQGIKDYISEKTPVPENQWSFIGLVHTASENRISFYLNGELTDTMKLLTPYAESDNTLLIGSNLWEEFFVGDMSEIKIWNRELNADEIGVEYLHRKNGTGFDSAKLITWIFVFFIGLGLALRRRVSQKEKAALGDKTVKEPASVIPEKVLELPENERNQIRCFGGLKVINHEGRDISQKFSPKLRQLFVLILLHSVGARKGISSKKLSDCLWPGMKLQNAKNIRGTNIQNLKALLANSPGIHVAFRDKLWVIEFSEKYFIDYDFVEASLNDWESGPGPGKINGLTGLIPILKSGPLFPNIRESWLDPYIDRMSNRIIEFGLNVFKVVPEGNQDNLLLDVAEMISMNDPLNEPALRKKISILTRQGKLSLAHSVFDNFAKLYFELYGEKYPGDVKSLFSESRE
jgi:two-component SAPR family response regulator